MNTLSQILSCTGLIACCVFSAACARSNQANKTIMGDGNMSTAKARSSVRAKALVKAQEKLLTHMEGRLKKLEKLLSQHGKGAYRSGPSIGLTGSDNTLLQSLHEFEQTVHALRQQQGQLSEQNDGLRKRLGEIDAINDRLRNQLTFLRDADSDAERLRQERVETNRLMAELKEHLTTAEVERLRNERRYYDLIREIITLKSDEASRFLALQSRLRGEITTLRPDTLKGSNDGENP